MSEISPLQKRVLELFGKSPLKNKFYWTGGTLLSYLYLHHRRSNDLDFFSDAPFTYNQTTGFIRNLKKKLKLPYIDEKKIFDRREFFIHNKQKLRLEFVFYPHPKIKARKLWKEIRVDSLDDIAANKFMSFFDRNDPKDLFDLYFLLTEGEYSIKKLINLTEKKFGIKFSKAAVFSEAHKSLKDLKDLKPFILAKNAKSKERVIKEIEDYFITLSDKYLHQIFK